MRRKYPPHFLFYRPFRDLIRRIYRIMTKEKFAIDVSHSYTIINGIQKGTVEKMDKISRTYHRGRVLCTLFAVNDSFAVSIEENGEHSEQIFFSLDDAKLVFRTACTLELLPSVLNEFCDFLTEEKIISA